VLATERKKRIRDLLTEYQHVDVGSLCAFLHVSPATVRRDLDALEKEGFLLKTYGGAVLNESREPESVLLKNADDPFEREKKAIAAFAVNLVEEGDVVFLGSGAIAVHMAKLLRHRGRLNVVTNNVSAALELLDAPGICAVLIGGDLAGGRKSAETYGEIAREEISRMYFGKCFLSFDGISLQRGYTVDNMNKLSLIRQVLANSDMKCALTDASNLGRISLHSVGPLDAVNHVVAPINIPEEYKEYYLHRGIRLYDVALD